ncbi:MAG: phage portal protein, partial [Planctomycetota bacterium]
MEALTTVIDAGVGLERRVVEDPTTVWEDIDAETMGHSGSSRHLTVDNAQCYGPVWQAMNVIAEDVAQLPLLLYQYQGEGKARDNDNPLYQLLHRKPNPESGPFQFHYLMVARALLWGNSYAWIEWEGGVRGGRVAALWPIEPGSCYPVRVNGELRYVAPGVGDGGRPEVYEPADIIHLRGPGTDALDSPSVIKKARVTILGGLASEEHGTRFYENNAQPNVVLEFPEAMDETAAKNVLRFWERRHAGPKNAGRPGFIDRGGKVHVYSMSHEDAQWLEGKRFSRTEVAGWFKIPPHKLGDLERATFSNIEHQQIEYVQSALVPWLIRYQDELNCKLLADDPSRFFEFLVNALLRGDSQSRAEFYASGVTNGWLTRNEVRARENLNPLEGLDEPLQPLNMTPAGEVVEEEQSARTMLVRN